MHLPVGTLLQGGRYEIIRYISSGGFGCTYEARDTKFKSRVKSVAIKEFFVNDFCNRDAGNNTVVVATQSKVELVNKLRVKFLEEANALFELEHPNIVRVTDTFEENGTAYYVMEYISGTTLAAIVDKEGSLSEEKALGYIRQVADALKYVHSHNRSHFDVKPQNIMVDSNDRAVLIDFGVSKQYDEVNGVNISTLVGYTPGYAPMELTYNDIADFSPTTDIYSLGATLFNLVTGTVPPSASRVNEDGLPVPVDVSAQVFNVIKAAMQPRRKDRPQNIDEFLSLLSENGKLKDESDGETVLNGNEKVERRNEKEHSAGAVISNGGEKSQKNKPGKSLWLILLLLLIAVAGAWFLFSGTGNGDAPKTDTTKTIEKKVNVSTGENKSEVTIVRIYVTNQEKYFIQYGKGGPETVDNFEELAKNLLKYKQRENSICVILYADISVSENVKRKIVDVVQENGMDIKLATKETDTLYSEKQPFIPILEGASNNMTPSSDISDNELIQMAADGNNQSLGSAEGNVEFSLAGRKGVSLPTERVTVKGNCTVVVRIEVDPNGNVIDATMARGTDTSDSSARNAALRFAKKSKFSKTTGSENQYGTITYKFKVPDGAEVYINDSLISPTLEKKPKPVVQDNSFKTREFSVNGVSFKMVAVVGGTFRMGSEDGESDEKPVHDVTVSDYYIGETEVTQALWEAVMDETQRAKAGDNELRGIGYDYPMYYISYDDCVAFVKKLNENLKASGQLPAGREFRLPTEAEWEFAARGGNRSQGYQYSGSNTLSSVAWYWNNGNKTTHPVKQKQANELGLYDMSGNVWEWCYDWYSNGYSSSSQTNPKGPSTGSYRVLRGGSWCSGARYCRVANRDYNSPGDRDNFNGLRLAL